MVLWMHIIQYSQTWMQCFLFVVSTVLVAYAAITKNIIESSLNADGMLMHISPELSYTTERRGDPQPKAWCGSNNSQCKLLLPAHHSVLCHNILSTIYSKTVIHWKSKTFIRYYYKSKHLSHMTNQKINESDNSGVYSRRYITLG